MNADQTLARMKQYRVAMAVEEAALDQDVANFAAAYGDNDPETLKLKAFMEELDQDGEQLRKTMDKLTLLIKAEKETG